MPFESDADNIRVSQDGSRVFVGYGDGALAIIDPKTQSKLGDIPLASASRELPTRERRFEDLRERAGRSRDCRGRWQ
jgi:hypothetical protein